MSPAFADTSYWVAITHPRDQWHARALDVSRTLVDRRLVTTETILIEFLNFFSGYGPYWRERTYPRATYRSERNDRAKALKELGVQTQFVIYSREGHPIQEREHQRDMLERILAWYDRHLER